MALYHKYRPATFAEVRGQEHVTRPLSVALDSGNIGHAYLFSGPRGCGKTSSARILARSLNCEHGPTSTPCGECESCRALAPGGNGNLDVTELDAASHGSVDDMRELRESAVFAPSESRYRIFIIDEAHMITPQGANALLKIVEEPPEHLVFIFATTEPEKIIGTIRSRVQHYPFRLLTPPVMRGLLQDVCAGEGVEVEDAVFTPVIRAGGGSPRDTLSILDQLLAGVPAGEKLSYELAAPLLGVTDSTLLDSAVRVIATHDAPGAFALVGQVIDRGIDPKRFTSDLLDRFRDLMVLQAVPDALSSGLVDAPSLLHSELTEEVQLFTGQGLPQITALVNTGLEGMRGTLAPRILLEVLIARLLAVGTGQPVIDPNADSPAAMAPPAPEQVSDAGKKYLRRSQRQGTPAQAQPQQPAAQPQQPQQSASRESELQKQEQSAPSQPVQQVPEQPQQAAPQWQSQPQETAPNQPEPQKEQEPEQPQAEPVGTVDAAAVQDKWVDILNYISREKKNTTARILLRGAKVLDVRDGTLYLGILTGAIANRLNAVKHNADIADAVKAELNVPLTVECVLGNTIPAGQSHPAPEPVPQQAAPQQPAQPVPHVERNREPVAPPSTRVEEQDEEAEQPETAVPHWKQRMNAIAARNSGQQAGNNPPPPPVSEEPDIPLPPEPTDEEMEEEMVRAATEDPGNFDHRTPKDMAMDLLQTELGARPM
ncbi:MAG: DNA polymerase III subunit gamma and tau [Corynebacterium glucuronolyticum]|nr:DNA polymerase III subunit gamma and tau [Corynebacterium glucuronolyticum]MDD7586602.1 DNA polymerase III subunit gamma and tau [Mycobacteriaceae bacterium]MDY5833941.1 DNA polymerase III subunit gamma and tau [Corynebacterium glucuronolyticum]